MAARPSRRSTDTVLDAMTKELSNSENMASVSSVEVIRKGVRAKTGVNIWTGAKAGEREFFQECKESARVRSSSAPVSPISLSAQDRLRTQIRSFTMKLDDEGSTDD